MKTAISTRSKTRNRSDKKKIGTVRRQQKWKCGPLWKLGYQEIIKGINMKELLFPRLKNFFKKSHLLFTPRSVFQLTLLKS